MLEMNGQDESGPTSLPASGSTPRAADLPDRRSQGSPRVDHPPGRHRAAGGRRHPSDFQRGFIKAEVVSFDDLIEAGSMAEAKSRGKVRIEGKVLWPTVTSSRFRFNV